MAEVFDTFTSGMYTNTVTIRNKAGIHCRPSAVIIKEMTGYEGEVRISTATGECDIRSVMGLLTLGLVHGVEVTIRVNGPDEEQWGVVLMELFTRIYDYPNPGTGQPE